MKEDVGEVDATPQKRLFTSIIADYGLKTGCCELIDNAIDAWNNRGRSSPLHVDIRIDNDLRTIRVTDNAGGIPEDELSFVVGPGQTGNDMDATSIGLFGVGSKRAVVALAKDITIRTRRTGADTFQVEFDQDWINGKSDGDGDPEEEWKLRKYRVDNIDPGTTEIILKELRVDTEPGDVEALARHIGRTYAKYIDGGEVEIRVPGANPEPVAAEHFDEWAYPPGYEPRAFTTKIRIPDEGEVGVRIEVGMTPHTHGDGEYGVYMYCNDRLVFKEKKDYSVGYGSGLAGQPHLNVSPVRMIVHLNGPASLMPWNSSKTDINPSHRVYEVLRPHIVEYLRTFNKVSRAFQSEFKTAVFPHVSGKLREASIGDIESPKKTHQPKPPASRSRYDSGVRKDNADLVKKKPWTRGLYEGVLAAEVIFRKKDLEQKNRVAVIILDSTLEIAFKEYLVHEAKIQISDENLKKLFSNRIDVQNRVKKEGPNLRKGTWTNITRFYKMRCNFVHSHADMTVPDDEVAAFRDLVSYVLKKLFKVKLGRLT